MYPRENNRARLPDEFIETPYRPIFTFRFLPCTLFFSFFFFSVIARGMIKFLIYDWISSGFRYCKLTGCDGQRNTPIIMIRMKLSYVSFVMKYILITVLITDKCIILIDFISFKLLCFEASNFFK